MEYNFGCLSDFECLIRDLLGAEFGPRTNRILNPILSLSFAHRRIRQAKLAVL